MESESFRDWEEMSFDEGYGGGEHIETDHQEHPDSSTSCRNKDERKKKSSKFQMVGEESYYEVVSY